MATQAPEDQVKFLVACFRNANPKPGKIDWKAVAAECGIITSGAAAKRWERLLKSNGITPSSLGSSGNGPGPSNPSTPKRTPAKGSSASGKTSAKASKKRKEVVSDDDDETVQRPKRNKKPTNDDDEEEVKAGADENEGEDEEDGKSIKNEVDYEA